jgi:hypothetical protein
MRTPERLARLVVAIQDGKNVPAIPLLELPSLEYRGILQMLKQNNYVMAVGLCAFVKRKKDDNTKKNLH